MGGNIFLLSEGCGHTPEGQLCQTVPHAAGRHHGVLSLPKKGICESSFLFLLSEGCGHTPDRQLCQTGSQLCLTSRVRASLSCTRVHKAELSLFRLVQGYLRWVKVQLAGTQLRKTRHLELC